MSSIRSGTVALSLACTAGQADGPVTAITWDGREYLDGDIGAGLLFDDSQHLSQYWYDTFGDLVGPVGEDAANAFILTLQRTDHLSVSLLARTGTVEADFHTKGVQTVLHRMDELCD